MPYRIGFIGTGPTPDEPSSDGFAMAYRHADAYRRLDDCALVACADIVPEHAERFADTYGLSGFYEDYRAMLDAEALDVVSVCVPPDVHADIVIGCAEHGDLEAIHCEKPMATTWRDCKAMGAACEAADVRLTFNHQKRVGPVYRRVKTLLDEGRIGDLRRVEWSASNLFDDGTHMFHLADYYADHAPVDWVLAGFDYRDENRHFGVHNENQAVAQWRYASGVSGLAVTGRSADAFGAELRLVGAGGCIELGATDGPPLRLRNGRSLGWRTVDVGETVWGKRAYATYPGYLRWGALLAARRLAEAAPGVSAAALDYPTHLDRAIESVVEAVREDGESPLSWRRALGPTEVIFAAWESARRRGRVDLPLDIDDNPLESLVARGELPVAAGEP